MCAPYPQRNEVPVGYVVLCAHSGDIHQAQGKMFVLPRASDRGWSDDFYPLLLDDAKVKVCTKARDDARLGTVQAR